MTLTTSELNGSPHISRCADNNLLITLSFQSRGQTSCYNYWISGDRVHKPGIGQHQLGPQGGMPLVWVWRRQGLTPQLGIICGVTITDWGWIPNWSKHVILLHDEFRELGQCPVKVRVLCLHTTAQIHTGQAREKAELIQQELENGSNTTYKTLCPSSYMKSSVDFMRQEENSSDHVVSDLYAFW